MKQVGEAAPELKNTGFNLFKQIKGKI